MMQWGSGMDRFILLPKTWAQWTKKGVVPLCRSDLPQVFILVVSPEFYARQDVILSDFQQQELEYLSQSSHGIFRSYILAQFIEGDGYLNLMGTHLWCHQSDHLLFQSSTEHDSRAIARYLKRFGLAYHPEKMNLIWPSIWRLLKKPSVINFCLEQTHRRAIHLMGMKMAITGLCLILSLGTMQAGYDALSHRREIQSYAVTVLSDHEKHQAQHYQAYSSLNPVSELTYPIYDRFVQEWHGRLVVTMVSMTSQECQWRFVMHPDYQDQSHQIADWLEIHTPGCQFSASETEHEYGVKIIGGGG